METRIRSFDWSRTPIGAPDTWSPALRTTIDILLRNSFPMLLWWGPEYISIYNDAYRLVLGQKHPWGLGRPVRECWSEIWQILKPLIDTPFHGGPATWMEDIELELDRSGFTEETHFTIGYSPVRDDTASEGIGGVLATVHEISAKVVERGGLSCYGTWAPARSKQNRQPKRAGWRRPRLVRIPKTFRSRCYTRRMPQAIRRAWKRLAPRRIRRHAATGHQPGRR
jgi:hypothetical protein